MVWILASKDRVEASRLLGHAIAALLNNDAHDDELALGFIEEALDHLKE